jgi:hypothetical protein
MTTDTPELLPVTDRYLINKRGLWYRPNSQGYTSNPAEAGRYTLEEAKSYTHPNGLDEPRDGMFYAHESEVTVPATRLASTPADDVVEAAARAMCVDGGFDPDEMMPNDGPRWKYYVSGARAALSTLPKQDSVSIGIVPCDAGCNYPNGGGGGGHSTTCKSSLGKAAKQDSGAE